MCRTCCDVRFDSRSGGRVTPGRYAAAPCVAQTRRMDGQDGWVGTDSDPTDRPTDILLVPYLCYYNS
jgi:hypothetical protein